MKSTKIRGELALLSAALLWGVSWVAQKYGALEIGGFTFVTMRSLFAAITLAVIVLVRRRKGMATHAFPLARSGVEPRRFRRNVLLLVGSALSFVLGVYCQQVALIYLSVGATSFITASYVILIPIVGLFMRKRVSSQVWIAALAALVGLYFLTVKEGLEVNTGSLIAFIGAVCWVAQVITIDEVVDGLDFVEITFLLFAFSFVFATVGMFVFEEVSLAAIGACIIPLLYCGVVGGAFGFMFQIYGQRFASPTMTGILLSTEALFALLSAFVILGEMMSGRELLGGVILLAAVLFAQLPERKSGSPDSQDASTQNAPAKNQEASTQSNSL